MKGNLGIFHCSMAMGPGKVVGYLLMGLNELKIDYKLNELSDNNLVLQNHKIIYEEGAIKNLILGPNVFDLPKDNKIAMNHDGYKTLIVASDWVKKLYTRWIPEAKVAVWNVGIDYNKYQNIQAEKKYDFLVYHKRRSVEDLNSAVAFLEKNKLKYRVISYGTYADSDFVNIISECKYGLIINNTETQGIAIQEMMSCNLPLLVWDVKEWTDRGSDNLAYATSIPYFDNRCGEVFFSIHEIDYRYQKLINSEYDPRSYIKEHCNYITQSQKLVDMFTTL